MDLIAFRPRDVGGKEVITARCGRSMASLRPVFGLSQVRPWLSLVRKTRVLLQVEESRDVAKSFEQRERSDGGSSHHTLKLALGDGTQTVRQSRRSNSRDLWRETESFFAQASNTVVREMRSLLLLQRRTF